MPIINIQLQLSAGSELLLSKTSNELRPFKSCMMMPQMKDGLQQVVQERASSPTKRFGKVGLARMGRFLRDERQARSLSLRALAEKSGLSASAIRALEAGQANPSLTTVLAVVEALDIDLDRAVEAARAGRQAVVIHRAGDDGATPLEGAALGLERIELPAESVRPPFPPSELHPSMGLVVESAVLVVVRSGARHRLETGDVYHAQPGVVQGLAGAGARSAHVLHVVDMRRTTDRPLSPGEIEN